MPPRFSTEDPFGERLIQISTLLIHEGLARILKENDTSHYHVLNERFHAAIYIGSHNAYPSGGDHPRNTAAAVAVPPGAVLGRWSSGEIPQGTRPHTRRDLACLAPWPRLPRSAPLPGKLHLVERLIQERPEFVECDKITGDDSFLARLVVHTIEQMDDVLEALSEHAVTSTAVIKGVSVKRRLPPL
ncbi:AsnC family transcriptional regulator protein (plasmid) [Rhizobium etli 8C-3]|uniref:AsnC family transcriptional regulator protein n=1 Tax=Rhizobium etli 8C-3 TaxID=538025 RepID=A0A1L5PCK7_RHIET|nr:AsnC family transcriptional regulator protein [Rhizobium etli 8C-3]